MILIHVDIDGVTSHGGYEMYNPRHNNPIPPVVVKRRTDPVDAVNIIGQHLLDSIKKFKSAGAAA